MTFTEAKARIAVEGVRNCLKKSVKKEYPKRIKLRHEIYCLLCERYHKQYYSSYNELFFRASEDIVKFVQNNYRRRKK